MLPAVAAEGDLPPVGRPGRRELELWGARQPPLPAPVGVQDVDPPAAVALAREDDLLPVGRPDRTAVEPPLAGQVPQSTAVIVDEVDLEVVGSGELRKAIVPSGNQARTELFAGRRVSLRCPLPSAFMM